MIPTSDAWAITCVVLYSTGHWIGGTVAFAVALVCVYTESARNAH